jgi:type II secretory pathway component PulK
MDKKCRYQQSGVALIIVIFIVALASVIVVNLAYSTYLGSRVSAGAQRAVQAVDILKSALSLAQVLIDAGNPNFDSPKDLWAQFYDGQTIPSAYLGLPGNNPRISLEIRPDDVRLNLKKLGDTSLGGAGNRKWEQIFTRFFTDLGFDKDVKETDQSGVFPGKHFTAPDLAVSLIEYMDQDVTSYTPGGYEGTLPNAKDAFPNTYMKSISELSAIPGFTSARINQSLPFLTVHGTGDVNINFVTGIRSLETKVLKALHPDITETMAQGIQAIALSDNPFTGSDARIGTVLGATILNDLGASTFVASSKYFQVIAEADYGTSRYFLRAHITRDRSASALPKVTSVEIF